MKRFSKFIWMVMILATLMALVIPTMAQEDVGPGEGGTVILSNIGGDPPSFNPIDSSDSSSSDVIDWMYPNIIGVDRITLEEAPNLPRALAAGWEYDETGTVLTLSLREDLFWADGEQITADDWLWAMNAVKSGESASPRTYVFYELDDGTVTEGPVHELTKIDDFTIEIKLGSVDRDDDGNIIEDEDGNPVLIPDCDAIKSLNDIPVVPEHAYTERFGDDYSSMIDDPYWVPETDNGFATYGPFTDPFIEFGVQVSLLADQTYTEGEAGFVRPDEWLYQNVEDSNIEYERFLAGDYTYVGISPNNQNAMRELASDGSYQVFEYPASGFTYVNWNLADPNNPQPGRDEEGNLVDQGLHPILGDVRVRQALAYAVDVQAMIGTRPDGDQPATGIAEGNGYAIGTHKHPGLNSTDEELEELGVAPYPYDPERADELLTEAGWIDEDGDGFRECHGCLYATEVDESYEGTIMEFELLTNAGNVIRESVGETMRAQLAEIGVSVNFQAIEWATLLQEVRGQTYDGIIIGWVGLSAVPGSDMLAIYGIGQDIPGSGFNRTSYQNPEFDAKLIEGNTLPGCDPDERNRLYAEAQQMIWEDQPILLIYGPNTMVAAQADVRGWDPVPYSVEWNLDSWAIGDAP